MIPRSIRPIQSILIAIIALQWSGQFINQSTFASSAEPMVVGMQQTDNLAAAEQAFDQGYQLYQQGSAESLRAALEKFKTAAQLYHAASNTSNTSREPASLVYVGFIYSTLGEQQKALEYYHQALPIWRAISDRDGEATTLTGIGAVYKSLGEMRKALEYYHQALPLYRAVGNRHGQAAALSDIGAVYKSLGETQKALEYYHQALPFKRAVADQCGEANIYYNLLYLWKNQQNLSLAIFYGKQLVNLYQSLRANIKDLDQELKKSFLDSYEKTYRDLAELLIAEGRLPEAQQVLGLLKEEELFEFVRRDNSEAVGLQARADYNSAETKSIDRRDQLLEQIAKSSLDYRSLLIKQSRTPDEEEQLSALAARLEVANLALQKFQHEELPSELANKGTDATLLKVKEWQVLQESLRELGPGTVAIYTIVEAEKYRLILVTPDRQKAAEFMITAADLNKKVFAFREVLQTPSLDPLPLAQALYKIIVGPIAKDLKELKAETLMWSLDGTLRYLPIAALHDGQHYLVEQYRNTVFTPASNDRIKDHPQAQWQGLALGFSKPNEKATKEGFNPLPAVAQELHTIIKEAGQSSGVIPGIIKLDDAFTAEAMKTLLRQRYPVVHIASHFQFRPGNEKDSFLLLGNGDHLDISQIKLLSFGGVDLLTLSACNTAMGDNSDGKEVEGFGVLAQRQGAKAVLASLWLVSDQSRALLMQEFYRLRAANPQVAKAELLRQAQQALLQGKISQPTSAQSRGTEIVTEKGASNDQKLYKTDQRAPFAHPHYWAPFILIGNWR